MKVYVVSKFGGEYEDKWETVVAVCATRELAESIKSDILKSSNPVISREEWDVITRDFYDYEDEHGDMDFTPEEISKITSQYSLEDIKDAYVAYEIDWDFSGVFIKEVDFYGNNS